MRTFTFSHFGRSQPKSKLNRFSFLCAGELLMVAGGVRFKGGKNNEICRN